ncbi:MAG: hypothetical protein M0P99_02155 [Candidatus Cloacimonetes bacterium]|nr:hypothetical protein [Candidatus Cloacimonadota bacterium]
MKRVLLIDPSLRVLPPTFFKEQTDIDIVAIIVESDREKDKVLLQRPEVIVYTFQDILNWNQTFVSHEEIIQYRPTQLKVERLLGRIIKTPEAKILSIYYTALAFWLHLFKEKIDCVLVLGDQEHGSFHDSIPIDIAKANSIPVYLTDVFFGKGGITLFGVLDCITDRHLKIQDIWFDYCPLNLDLVLFDHNRDNEYIPPEIKNRIMRLLFLFIMNQYVKMKKLLSDLSGHHIVIDNEKRRCTNLILKLYSPIIFFLNTYINKNDSRFFALGIYCRLTFGEFFHFTCFSKSLKHYYNKHAVSMIPDNQNAVLFFLHLEPEASIMNRSVYNCQIYNIKMLARYLPKGWMIYLKEHPATFGPQPYPYLKTMENYRSKEYYKELLSIPNVSFLDWKIPGSVLLSNKMKQVRAIATINGTVSLECLYQKKPVIIFGPENCPYADIPEVLTVRAETDLPHIFEKLVNGYSPRYDMFQERLSEYLLIRRGDMNEKINIPPQLLINLIEKCALYNL